jgi:hypothetical protein
MKAFLCLLAGVAMLCGCKPVKVQNTPPPQQSESAKTPVVGAYGWTLGQVIPDNIELLSQNGTLFYKYDTNGVFPHVCLAVNSRREIYTITAYTDSEKPLSQTEIDALVEKLTDKYGLKATTVNEDGKEWMFGGTNWVALQAGDKNTVIYYGADKLIDEMRRQAIEKKKNSLPDL